MSLPNNIKTAFATDTNVGGKCYFYMPCVINVTEWGAGDARNVAPLAFDAMSDGKPTFTPA